MPFAELLQTPEQIAAPAGIDPRRHPGRNDQVSPYLIPLLRNPATMEIPAPLPGEMDTTFPCDDLAAMRGIIFGLVLSVPLWASVAGALWAVLH